MYVDESNRLLVYRGCSLWGMGSEDKFYHRPICVTLGKLLYQFLLISGYLSLPFLSPILSCFVWLDCLVVRDYLLRHVQLLTWNSLFSCCCSNSHSVCLGGPREGKKELQVCVCFVLWKHMHFWMSARDFFSVLSCVRGTDKWEPKHECGKVKADTYLCRWARTQSLHP